MPRMGLEEVSISGIWLRREGDYAVVEVERKLADGTFKWYEIIRESHHSNYSHIVEPNLIHSLFWDCHRTANHQPTPVQDQRSSK